MIGTPKFENLTFHKKIERITEFENSVLIGPCNIIHCNGSLLVMVIHHKETAEGAQSVPYSSIKKPGYAMCIFNAFHHHPHSFIHNMEQADT
jgi:hypothetical protein